MEKVKVFLATFFLTIAAGVSAQVSIHDMTDTWNDGATTFDAIKMDVTDTASAADSKLLNLQIGGTPMFTVDKDGDVTYAGTLPGAWAVSDDVSLNYGHGLNALALLSGGGASDGNVAIGSEALSKLTDSGNYDDNVSIGYRAGRYIIAGANTFVGYRAGEGQSGLSTGVANVGIGHGSLQDFTTSNYNAAIGYLSGANINAGSANTVIGYDADVIQSGDEYAVSVGASTLADSYAIAIGYQAKAEVDSIAIGANALDSTTTGAARNIAIGRDAGGANTTGDDNIAIGDDAYKTTTTGLRNIAIGSSALGTNQPTPSANSNNIAIGYHAGVNASGASGNILVGTDVATGLTGGDFNVLIGYSAAENITTGTRNLYVGCIGVDASAVDVNGELCMGQGSVNAQPTFFGKMGAYLDVDVSSDNLAITGPSAYKVATTNLDGGTLTVQGGLGASASAGDADGGNLILKGGTGYGTGDDGFALVNDSIYGIMSTQGGATSQDDIGTTPEILVAWNTDGIANGITVDHTSDYMTAQVAGVYEVIANVSFSGTGGSVVDIEIYVYDDSGTSWGASGFELQRKLGTGGDVGNAGTAGLVTLDVDDRVALYIATDGATDDVTVTEAQLQMKRISD